MIPVWPVELPLPNRQGYNFGREEARLKTTMDAGPQRYKLMSSVVVDPVALAITVDRNGKAIFDEFYVEDTARGAKAFLMPDPTTDGWFMTDEASLLLLDENDVPLLFSETWLCTFGDTPPGEIIAGTEFTISFTVGVYS